MMKAYRECEKIELAETAGFRVIYCTKCEVVELEIGALSLRLTQDMVQHFANVLMKGSLKLERLTQSGIYEKPMTAGAGALH
jgi:hypothetical protein